MNLTWALTGYLVAKEAFAKRVPLIEDPVNGELLYLSFQITELSEVRLNLTDVDANISKADVCFVRINKPNSQKAWVDAANALVEAHFKRRPDKNKTPTTV